MAPRSTPTVPAPNPDQRRVAAENRDRARQVIATGNFDYGISLLTLCCQLDPGNLTYRGELRRAQKEKYGDNLRGSRFAFFTTPRLKARVSLHPVAEQADADAGSDFKRMAGKFDRLAGMVQHVLDGSGQGRVPLHILEDQQELVAAQPGQGIPVAQVFLETGRDDFQ